MSNKTSCVEHPANQTLVILREDYLAICSGDDCAAAILNYFEQWQNSKNDAVEQWRRECEICEKNGESLPPTPETWVYASQEQIQYDLMFTYGERKIANSTEWLVEVGFLLQRNNPKLGWDRTKQYLFNVEFVQIAIRENAGSIGAKMRNGNRQKRGIEPRKNAEAIPQNTTENTQQYEFLRTFKILTGSIVLVENETKRWQDEGKKAATLLIAHGLTTDGLTAFYKSEYTGKYKPSSLMEIARKMSEPKAAITPIQHGLTQLEKAMLP